MSIPPQQTPPHLVPLYRQTKKLVHESHETILRCSNTENDPKIYMVKDSLGGMDRRQVGEGEWDGREVAEAIERAVLEGAVWAIVRGFETGIIREGRLPYDGSCDVGGLRYAFGLATRSLEIQSLGGSGGRTFLGADYPLQPSYQLLHRGKKHWIWKWFQGSSRWGVCFVSRHLTVRRTRKGRWVYLRHAWSKCLYEVVMTC